MTDLEKIIDIYSKRIQVSIPCKIVSLNGMYANVKPLLYDVLELPVISSVPILFIGSKSKKLKFKNSVGDIVTVFFTQLDLGKLIAYGTAGQVNSKESFNLTNAFALPFNLHTKVDEEKMAVVDFEIIGDMNITGNINVTGNIGITGSLNSTDTITSDSDCIGGGISLKGHTHGGVKSGGDSTSTPS